MTLQIAEEVAIALRLLPEYPQAKEAATHVAELERDAAVLLRAEDPPRPSDTALAVRRARVLVALGRRLVRVPVTLVRLFSLVRHWSPRAESTVRVAGAAVVLFALARATGRLRSIKRNDWPLLLLSSAGLIVAIGITAEAKTMARHCRRPPAGLWLELLERVDAIERRE